MLTNFREPIAECKRAGIAGAVGLLLAAPCYGQAALERGSRGAARAEAAAQREAQKWQAEKMKDGTITVIGKKPTPFITVGEKFFELEKDEQASLLRMVFKDNLAVPKREKQPSVTIYADAKGKPGKKLGTWHVKGGLKLAKTN